MTESSNFEALKAHIIPLSVASDWYTASAEWEVYDFRLHDDWDSCPCGHKIKEQCFIRNKQNGNETYVGNVCVNRFGEINTGNLFAGLRRIANDIDAAPNADLIEHAQKMGFLFEKEYGFLMSTKLKRKLSGKQLAWRQRINARIIKQKIVHITPNGERKQ